MYKRTRGRHTHRTRPPFGSDEKRNIRGQPLTRPPGVLVSGIDDLHHPQYSWYVHLFFGPRAPFLPWINAHDEPEASLVRPGH
jgi:hypothetical protein